MEKKVPKEPERLTEFGFTDESVLSTDFVRTLIFSRKIRGINLFICIEFTRYISDDPFQKSRENNKIDFERIYLADSEGNETASIMNSMKEVNKLLSLLE